MRRFRFKKERYAVDRRRRLLRPRHRNPYAPSRRKLRRGAYLTLVALFSAGLFYSSFSLVSYYKDLHDAQQLNDGLREIYYAERPEITMPQSLPTFTPAPATATPPPLAAQSEQPKVMLEAVKYPNNPYTLVSSRFTKLQRQNKDIIGWLKIDNLLDEPVVHRDNEYYLDRDYLGYHNVNGAVFLNEECDLRTRPYTMILYGHNMKTGARFGSLRNYENIVYYKNSPFISFETAYESGQYIIFSVATVSIDAAKWNYLDFSKLMSNTITWRKEAIDTLVNRSAFSKGLDVKPEDQLLLLVTCVDDQTERRVIAARRLRDGETEEELRKQLNKVWAK